MKPNSFEARALLLLMWLISDACGIKTENFPCVQRNELGGNHPPSSVSFSDVSSQIGLSEAYEYEHHRIACFHNTTTN